MALWDIFHDKEALIMNLLFLWFALSFFSFFYFNGGGYLILIGLFFAPVSLALLILKKLLIDKVLIGYLRQK